jgi:excisionase family DNA binding protein
MKIPMTPSQAAKSLGVATVTVYKWIEAKKIPSTTVTAGHSIRIYIDPDDVEIKRAELESQSVRIGENTPQMEETSAEWVKKYQDLIGKVPPLYGAFRSGKVTAEQMKAETFRRFDALK